MKNNFKHGDIFDVEHGCWNGIYLNYDNQPYIYSYKTNHIYNLMYYNSFDMLKLYRTVIKVDEDTFERMTTTYMGNIFEISKDNVKSTKEEYEEALYIHDNIDKYFAGGE